MAEKGRPPKFEGHEIVQTKADLLGRSDAIGGWHKGGTRGVFVVSGEVLKVGHDFQQQGCVRIEKFQIEQILEIEDEREAKELIERLEAAAEAQAIADQKARDAAAGVGRLDEGEGAEAFDDGKSEVAKVHDLPIGAKKKTTRARKPKGDATD